MRCFIIASFFIARCGWSLYADGRRMDVSRRHDGFASCCKFVGSTGGSGAQRWLLTCLCFLASAFRIMKVASAIMYCRLFLRESDSPQVHKHVFWSLVLVMLPAAPVSFQPRSGYGITDRRLRGLVCAVAGRHPLETRVFQLHWCCHTFQPRTLVVLYVRLPEAEDQDLAGSCQSDHALGAGWNIIRSQTAM